MSEIVEYLRAWANGSSDLPVPKSRDCKYLQAIITGDTSNLPTPISEVDNYLYTIAINGTGGTGLDTSDATAQASDILLNKTAYAKGIKLTGTIQSKTAETFTPSTVNQTIESGVYIDGEQTIKGDINLIASNIKKDISIFGVVGTLETADTPIEKSNCMIFDPNVTKIDNQAFICGYCIKEVYIPNWITSIGDYAFQYCDTITILDIPSSVTSIGSGVFQYCTKLENVTIGRDFNANLDISASTLYSVDTLVNILTNLKDLTGDTSKTLAIGSANLSKLTDEQKAIATSKNWILS